MFYIAVSWDSQGTSGDVPKLKGARFFTFDEVQKSTNNFSEINNVGSGGYGKVDFNNAGLCVIIKFKML